MAENYKKVKKNKRIEAGKLMDAEQLNACHIAIHSATATSGVLGAVPIPFADAIPISAAQITMVIALGKIFHQEITSAAAKGLIGAAASTLVGRNLVKFIPIVGWGVSAVVAAGVTEAIGWTIAVDMAKNNLKEQVRKEYAQEAAEAYAEAEYYKQKAGDDSDEEAEDICE